jgi:hypothetical protein
VVYGPLVLEGERHNHTGFSSAEKSASFFIPGISKHGMIRKRVEQDV